MNPEKPMSGIHAISAPPKAPDAPPFPKPQESPLDNFIRTRERTEQREAERPKGWRGIAANLWGNALVRFGLGGLVIGGGAYEAYQNVPAIHTTVDNLTGQGELVVPDTFDPTAKEGVIGANNSIVVTPEQYVQMQKDGTAPPTIDTENKRFNIPLAIRFKDDAPRTLKYKLAPVEGKPNATIYIDELEEGDTLLSPVDGKIKFSRFIGLDGLTHFQTFYLDSHDPKREHFSLIYSTATIEIKPLMEIPFSDNKAQFSLEIEVKKGQPIGTVIDSKESFRIEDGHQLRIVGFGGDFAFSATSEKKATMIQ